MIPSSPPRSVLDRSRQSLTRASRDVSAQNTSAMTLARKLDRRMLQLGLSQQALAQKSGVSDSEVSRLLKGQSKRPGLPNILRLARALEVSVDFLADDSLQDDPHTEPVSLPSQEQALLELARTIGSREVEMILDATRILGFETAIRRLYGVEFRPFPSSPSHSGATGE
ncbi:helix-turn-helix domain-containing protein [Tautonia rosea]|uniref:helix-turn-helix domain-containing protein n=1 Tax=Tautonia rosea TaxID=2728037 RepID=UPI001601CF3F|nr:helix-turn-helix transcriptional regulator [Tautonia rosea]